MAFLGKPGPAEYLGRPRSQAKGVRVEMLGWKWDGKGVARGPGPALGGRVCGRMANQRVCFRQGAG